MMRLALILLLAAFMLAAACLPVGSTGSTGGGGGGTNVTVFGRIIWIETGSAPSPAATVRIGPSAEETDPLDGSFQLSVPTGSAQAQVTYAPNLGAPVVRTFDFPAVGANTDLGDLFIGPEQVTVTGRVIDSTSLEPVSSALVQIAGLRAVTNSSGQFSVPNVAYSSSALAVFLGLQGSVTRTGYFAQFFSPPGAAIGGVVEIGDIAATPEGSTTPPPLPTNLTVVVRPIAAGAGAQVVVRQGGLVIRQGVADSSGRAVFWLPAGAFDVSAAAGAQSGAQTVEITSPNDAKQVQIDLS